MTIPSARPAGAFSVGVLGDIGEWFVKKETFDVYYCPRCGKVDFYVDGVGEDLRPQ